MRKAAPGFLVNRLPAALTGEALSIVQKGFASPQDVDTVLKNGHARRGVAAGTFEFVDLVGWDLASPALAEVLPDIDSSLYVLDLEREKAERGELGVKAGKGLFDWTPESVAALQSRLAHAIAEVEKWAQ